MIGAKAVQQCAESRFGVSMPLCFFGSYLGLSKPPIELPVRTNVIPRSIPKQPWFMDPLFSFLISGVLPFGAVRLLAFLADLVDHEKGTKFRVRNARTHRCQLVHERLIM